MLFPCDLQTMLATSHRETISAGQVLEDVENLPLRVRIAGVPKSRTGCAHPRLIRHNDSLCIDKRDSSRLEVDFHVGSSVALQEFVVFPQSVPIRPKGGG